VGAFSPDRPDGVLNDESVTQELDAARFVADYQRIRDMDDSPALGRLWDPDGTLHHPNLSRPIRGAQLPAFNDYTLSRLPDLCWALDDWATRGNVVYLEWTCRATVSGNRVVWSGVDRIEFHRGLITKEIVYCDTMPLLEAREPSMRRPALIDADHLG
jgi:hypothetical protein